MRFIALPRRLLRQLIYLILFVLLIGSLVTLVDLFYYTVLPNSIHSKLVINHPDQVVVQLKLKECSRLRKCSDKDSSEWYRIPKDLNLGKSWVKKLYLLSSRVKTSDLDLNVDRVILDVTVAADPQDFIPNHPNVPVYVWQDIQKSLSDGTSLDITKMQKKDVSARIKESGWEPVSHGLWVKRGLFDPKASVTGIDVLFGKDAVDPRPQWRVSPGRFDSASGSATDGLPARLTYRIGTPGGTPHPELRVDSQGQFKILQVSDLHFSTGVGVCRDPFPPETAEGCEADPRTLKFLAKVLEEEKPDFVVLSGDTVSGTEAPDAQSAFFKAVAPFISRKIPFAVTMGNHDDQGNLRRPELMSLAASLPYSLSSRGPADVEGVGNYVLQILAQKNDHPAVTLYFLDTHKYSSRPKTNPGYDWIKPSQLKFLKSTYEALKPQQEEYTHIHMSMGFFHIPLTEYRESGHPIVGSYKEGSTAPPTNSGARDVLADIGVSVVSVGHDHANDFCMFHEKTWGEGETQKESNMWLCHAGGAGEGGYGGHGGFSRRVRVFLVDTQSNSISSWKRVEGNEGEKLDEQVLVAAGKAEYVESE